MSDRETVDRVAHVLLSLVRQDIPKLALDDLTFGARRDYRRQARKFLRLAAKHGVIIDIALNLQEGTMGQLSKRWIVGQSDAALSLGRSDNLLCLLLMKRISAFDRTEALPIAALVKRI